jgi:hypothetical protein
MMKMVFRCWLLMGLPLVAFAHDYPTLERVDHVLTCMRLNGGQNVDNLYACACEVDIIAQQISFKDFSEARTFEIYKKMPGEKGGLFRDSEVAKELTTKLDSARADAKKRCFIGIKRKPQEIGAPPPVTPAGAPQALKPPSASAPQKP